MIEGYINNELRQLIEGDGGYIEFKNRTGDEITVIMRGECSVCAKTPLCLKWCEEMIQKNCNEKVKLSAEKIKPYFRDK